MFGEKIKPETKRDRDLGDDQDLVIVVLDIALGNDNKICQSAKKEEEVEWPGLAVTINETKGKGD